MKKELTPAQRLIVAADSEPRDSKDSISVQMYMNVLGLCKVVEGTGVVIKVNSALRAAGYDVIDLIHDHGLKCFADLKLFDIPATLEIEGMILATVKPDMLTVACSAGVKSLAVLKEQLPETEVLGVTILTTLEEQEVWDIHMDPIQNAAVKLARIARRAKLDGIISSADEIGAIRKIIGEDMSINTPCIRPEWCIVENDDQNKKRAKTPLEAIKDGADRIVVGRPITQAKNLRDAVMRTIEEIEQGLAAREK